MAEKTSQSQSLKLTGPAIYLCKLLAPKSSRPDRAQLLQFRTWQTRDGGQVTSSCSPVSVALAGEQTEQRALGCSPCSVREQEGQGEHAKSWEYIDKLMERPEGTSMVNSNTDCTPYI